LPTRLNIRFRAKKFEKVEYLSRKCGCFFAIIQKVLGCGDKTETGILVSNRQMLSNKNVFTKKDFSESEIYNWTIMNREAKIVTV
jgi:nitrogen regulatory protein PII